MTTARPGRPRGFTLVEMLVALTIFSLLSLLITDSYRFTRRIWAGSESLANDFIADDLSRKLLEGQFHRALPEPTITPDGAATVAFSGSDRSLLFIVPANPAGGAGPQIDLLSIEPLGQHARLVLRERAFDPSRDSWPPPDDPARWPAQPLFGGLDRADLGYFGMTLSGQPAWQPAWRNRTSLPALIRLRLWRDGARAPDVVVAPAIGGDGGISFLAQRRQDY